MKVTIEKATQVIPGAIETRGAKGRKRKRAPMYRWTPGEAWCVDADGQHRYRSTADYPDAKTTLGFYARTAAVEGPNLAVRGKWTGSSRWSAKDARPVITLRRTMATRIRCVIVSAPNGWEWTVTRSGRGPDKSESGRGRELSRVMRRCWQVALGLVAGVCGMEGVTSPKRAREGGTRPTDRDFKPARK